MASTTPEVLDLLNELLKEVKELRNTVTQQADTIHELQLRLASPSYQQPTTNRSNKPSSINDTPEADTATIVPTASNKAPTPWANPVDVLTLRNNLANKAATKADRRANVAARQFMPLPEDQGFIFLYIQTRSRMSPKQTRQYLRQLGINTRRILYVHYHTRNVLSLLIHVAFQQDLIETLTNHGIKPIPYFDPLDPKHLMDPQYADYSEDQRANIMHKITGELWVQAVRFLRPPIRTAVAKYLYVASDLTKEEVMEFVPANFFPATPSTDAKSDTAASTPGMDDTE
ncbi:unnamed protein product [Absidia cylindrospora]